MSGAVPFMTLLGRCLLSRCPVCGRGRFFPGTSQLTRLPQWFIPLGRCDLCHFRYERQPGYYFGVLTPVLPIMALVTGLIFAAVAYFGFDCRVEAVLGWGIAGVASGLLLFFRPAIAVYVALDHAIDPPVRDGDKP